MYGNFVLRSVDSTSDPYCTLPEWLAIPLRGSTDFYADAAFFTLRAHAARKPNSQSGLIAALHCGSHEGPFRAVRAGPSSLGELQKSPHSSLRLPEQWCAVHERQQYRGCNAVTGG
jgi:hypothetical protein